MEDDAFDVSGSNTEGEDGITDDGTEEEEENMYDGFDAESL